MPDLSLTRRQIEILNALVAHGNVKSAARTLGIAPRTADTQCDRIRKVAGSMYAAVHALGAGRVVQRPRSGTGPSPSRQVTDG